MYSVLGPLSLLGTAFWIWMLYDCLKNGTRSGYTWIWIMLFLNVIGAGLYFFIVWLPNHPNALSNMPWVSRGRLRNALWQAEAEARNIGKAHQYMKLGDIHYQMRNLEAAEQAYSTALEREPDNVKALWGAACVAIDQQALDAARQHLKTLLSIQPEFSYGDASLAYGQVLYQMENFEAAQAHLQQHIKSWSHPPIYLMLAQIYQQQGDFAQARETLETMIIKIKSSTQFQYRKNQRFIRQGERLLAQLS
ncbi:MAG: tetratricopeptide repeat protein [Leptolyngbya sp. SIO1E4]|nr:tetratricopeptide repeat protein [Leptolyngbya sp. SIO1E4]